MDFSIFSTKVCEKSQVLLAVVSGGFPGVLPFGPTYLSIYLFILQHPLSSIMCTCMSNFP